MRSETATAARIMPMVSNRVTFHFGIYLKTLDQYDTNIGAPDGIRTRVTDFLCFDAREASILDRTILPEPSYLETGKSN
jgi:hypothetical protein